MLVHKIVFHCSGWSLSALVQIGLSKGQDWDIQRYLCESSQNTLWQFSAFESLDSARILLGHSKRTKNSTGYDQHRFLQTFLRHYVKQNSILHHKV